MHILKCVVFCFAKIFRILTFRNVKVLIVGTFSQNHIAKSDPLAWKIIDNKLYLNYDFEVQAMWLKDPKKRIEMANKNWPSILK